MDFMITPSSVKIKTYSLNLALMYVVIKIEKLDILTPSIDKRI